MRRRNPTKARRGAWWMSVSRTESWPRARPGGEVHEAQQAGLAGAGRAQEPAEGPGRNAEREVVQNLGSGAAAGARVAQPHELESHHRVPLCHSGRARGKSCIASVACRTIVRSCNSSAHTVMPLTMCRRTCSPDGERCGARDARASGWNGAAWPSPWTKRPRRRRRGTRRSSRPRGRGRRGQACDWAGPGAYSCWRSAPGARSPGEAT